MNPHERVGAILKPVRVMDDDTGRDLTSEICFTQGSRSGPHGEHHPEESDRTDLDKKDFPWRRSVFGFEHNGCREDHEENNYSAIGRIIEPDKAKTHVQRQNTQP